jgi:hypothetical protein
MTDQVLALLATAGWILLVGVILALFGTTSGGAWSIAGSVARGVTEWVGSRVHPGAVADASSDGSEPMHRSTSSTDAETEDLGSRPT